VERKEYFYNPIDFDKDVAVGIQLPFGKTKGLFKLSYTTEEQAISNLKNLLLTRKGERLFQPTFGSSVYTYLFEQFSPSFDSDIEESVRADIAEWLPYIVVDSIVVDSEEDRNRFKLSLNYRVTEQGANREITMFVDSTGESTLQG